MASDVQQVPLRVISPAAAADRAGVSVRTLQRRVRERAAPAPVRLGPGKIGFYEHEVQAWLANLPRTREVA